MDRTRSHVAPAGFRGPSRVLCWIAAAVLTAACAPETPQFTPVADVRDVMISVLEPAAEVYWDAVGEILDENGVHEIRPSTDEEWDAVRNAAFVMAESGNLLMMNGRARDRGEWTAISQAMIESGREALRAAEARNTAAIFDAGAEVYYVCSECHAKYALETLRPSDTRTDSAESVGVGADSSGS